MLSESNTRKINTQDVDTYYKNFLASVTSNLLSEKEIRSVNMWENKAYTESILESDILIFSPLQIEIDVLCSYFSYTPTNISFLHIGTCHLAWGIIYHGTWLEPS